MARNRFHINPKTGNIAQCRARSGNCPFGAEDAHFASRESAHDAYEKQMAENQLHPHRKRMVLADVDGTLTKSSLVLTNAAVLHDQGDIDLGDAPARWRADMKNEALITELAVSYQKSLIGKSVAFASKAGTVAKMLSDKDNFYSTLDRLVEYKRRGYEVVLVTGSPDYLVKPFADKFGFKYLATVQHQDEEGRFTGEITLMAGAAAKRKAIADLELEDYEEVVGMGDTASDIPILEVAHHKVLVDPTQETLKALAEHNIVVDDIIHS